MTNKKAVFCSLTAIIFLIYFLGGCSGIYHLSLPDNMQSVSIYKEGGSLTTFSYTDSNKIKVIKEYFESLDLKPSATTPNGPEKFYAGGWQIRFSAEQDTFGIDIVADKFLQSMDGKWWEIPEEQAKQFETILKEQIPDVLPENPLFKEWDKQMNGR